MIKRIVLMPLMALMAVVAMAQITQPVHWSSSIKMVDDTRGKVVLTANIDPGWHLYDTQLPDGGPQPTVVTWQQLDGVRLDGTLRPDRKPVSQHDETFDMDLAWWTGKVTFTQAFTATRPQFALKGQIAYMSCNDEQCTAPTKEVIDLKGKAIIKADEPSVADQPVAVPDTTAAAATVVPDSLPEPAAAVAGDTSRWWNPVTVDIGVAIGDSGGSLWGIFLACFLGGLLALLTPCVWPIIPLTVSFFLKQSGNRARAIANAVIYGLAIVVIYVALGMLVTMAFGASELNAIATNAVCNIIFFILLVVFAISFFGAFDIKLPESWGNRMDSAASRTTGLLSIFFMAFTLVIVSFSCTGPIIGTLLVEAANQGNRMGPAIGMLGFALALAIPFSLFAMFPSLLKQLPRSGSWLNTVKVVLGFIELALSLKFLSVADLAYGWHILDREVFLALWIVIFGLLGLYLLGIFAFAGEGRRPASIGVFRFFLAMTSLAFAVYLVPGLWGAPLRATSAFTPPLSTQDFNLYGDDGVEFDDFEAGMQAAERAGKPVLIDFSGFGCVNCRKMEGAVLDRDEVKQAMRDGFVTIRLMVDDKAPLPVPRTVVENGRQVPLDTRGDLWSYLQRHKFNANSQPYYVVLDNDGRLLSGPFVYREDVDGFMNFLKQGQQRYAQ